MAYYSNALYLYGFDTEKGINCLYKFDLDSEIWSLASYSNSKNPISYHKSYAYLDNLYIFFGVGTYTTLAYGYIQKYSLIDDSWTAQNFSSVFRTSFSSVQKSNLVYLLFGQSETITENSIQSFSLGDQIESTILINSADFPKKRKNHVSFVFDSEFYIFAGICENGEYLNDMWKFNFDSLRWTKLELTGAIPSGRELISYSKIDGLGFTFIGGRNAEEIFNDIYFFELKNKFFLIIPKTVVWRSPGFSSCFVNKNPTYVEIGGRDYYSLKSDLFIYDYLRIKGR